MGEGEWLGGTPLWKKRRALSVRHPMDFVGITTYRYER